MITRKNRFVWISTWW